MASCLNAFCWLRDNSIANQTTSRTDAGHLVLVLECQYYSLIYTLGLSDALHKEDIELIIKPLANRVLEAKENLVRGNQIDFITCMYEVSTVAESFIRWYNIDG